MAKYIFVGTHEDIYKLIDLGYRDNLLNENRPIELTDDFGDTYNDYLISEVPELFNGKNFVAVKTWHDKVTKTGVAVAIDYRNSQGGLSVYRYKGNELDHKKICTVRNKLPYLQELIDAELVEIVGK